jgi:O-acetylhomoserine/O-acetylserine sulfhydrylase-like pyridoxal-dependent enzyme
MAAIDARKFTTRSMVTMGSAITTASSMIDTGGNFFAVDFRAMIMSVTTFHRESNSQLSKRLSDQTDCSYMRTVACFCRTGL